MQPCGPRNAIGFRVKAWGPQECTRNPKKVRLYHKPFRWSPATRSTMILGRPRAVSRTLANSGPRPVTPGAALRPRPGSLRTRTPRAGQAGRPRTQPGGYSRNSTRPLKMSAPSAVQHSLLGGIGTGTVGLPDVTCDLWPAPELGQLGPTPAFHSH